MKIPRLHLARLATALPFARVLPKAAQRAPRVAQADAARITDTIARALSAAGIDPRSGTSVHARDTIQSALRAVGVAGTPTDPASDRERPAPRDSEPSSPAARGASSDHRFANDAGARDYTLYVPAGHDPATHDALPLVVMLHGCTQSPADFAAGTRMNALADAHGVLVAWPSQAARDNGSRCWNWFRPDDQARGAGEPAILAGIVGDIAASHRVDARRVYVAGLSAGAGMAVILGRAYPDVFAAVGAHSGLPYGAAHDVPSAFAAMQGGSPPAAAGDAARRPPAAGRAMPTIVFHGNADRTVHQRNGTAIVSDAVARFAAQAPLTSTRSEVPSGDGRACTREAFVDAAGHACVEHWVVHGAGHAWSGGDAAGSYTDPTGPDASAQMLRFFLQHAH